MSASSCMHGDTIYFKFAFPFFSDLTEITLHLIKNSHLLLFDVSDDGRDEFESQILASYYLIFS